jgi:putative DNA primase/helicase
MDNRRETAAEGEISAASQEYALVHLTRLRATARVAKQYRIGDKGEFIKDNAPDVIYAQGEVIEIPLDEITANAECKDFNVYGVPGAVGSAILTAPKKFCDANPETGRRPITIEQFRFEPNQPAVIFFDNDPAPEAFPPIPHHPALGLMRLLREEWPEVFADAGFFGTPSSGSGTFKSSAGEVLKQGAGTHLYLAALDGSDLPRFETVLIRRLWLHGYGSIKVAKKGALMTKTIIDATLSGQRIDYIAPPVLRDGITRENVPENVSEPGGYVDTRLLPDLTPEEEAKYQRLIKEAKARPEVLIKVAAIKLANADASISVSGGSGDLLPTDSIRFRDHGTKTVAEILKNPKAYDQAECADPGDPDATKMDQAKFFFNDGEKPLVRSFAGGGTNYFFPIITLPDLASVDMYDVTTALLKGGTQDSVALAVVQLFKEKILFNHSANKWHVWDGQRWRPDHTGETFHKMRQVARTYGAGKQSSSAPFVKGVEVLCRNDPRFAVRGSDFDSDSYLLNTPDGVIDLRDNVMRPHDAALRLSKMTAVGPASEGGDRFLQFLNEITCGDEELIEFHQITLGSCLSGAREVHGVLFWKGFGRNGKSTLGELLEYILGDYCGKIPAATLMQTKNEHHPTGVAALMGLRLALSSEINDGDHWNEALLNELSGDARLTARYMGGNFFTFDRTHKHLIFGNHRPQVRNATEALKKRLYIVPFKAKFTDADADPDLPKKLRAEAGYVLAWLMDGHRKWLENGKRWPKCVAVVKESGDFFASQSTVEAWVEENTSPCDDEHLPISHWSKATGLYQNYRLWKIERGEHPPAQARFTEALKRTHLSGTSNGLRFAGIRLKNPEEVSPRGLAAIPSVLLPMPRSGSS